MWYQFLNIFFFVFHTAITLFNITGWLFHPTRKWNIVTLLLTAFSWFFLGIWFLLQLVHASMTPGEGIAFWAHAGGFVVGLMAGGWIRYRDRALREYWKQIPLQKNQKPL